MQELICEGLPAYVASLSMRSGKVVRRWVSRFDIYPYLERYTVDAAAEINRQVFAAYPNPVLRSQIAPLSSTMMPETSVRARTLSLICTCNGGHCDGDQQTGQCHVPA